MLDRARFYSFVTVNLRSTHKLLHCLKNRVDEQKKEEEKKKMTVKRALMGETENAKDQL